MHETIINFDAPSKAVSTALLSRIRNRMGRMKDGGRADPGMLDDLGELRNYLVSIGDKWTRNRGRDRFYFYRAVRNAELVLELMAERFADAGKKPDPRIVQDALTVIPAIRDIIRLTESGAAGKDRTYLILEKTRQLRDMAAEAGLIESEARDMKDINSEQARNESGPVVRRLGIPWMSSKRGGGR